MQLPHSLMPFHMQALLRAPYMTPVDIAQGHRKSLCRTISNNLLVHCPPTMSAVANAAQLTLQAIMLRSSLRLGSRTLYHTYVRAATAVIHHHAIRTALTTCRACTLCGTPALAAFSSASPTQNSCHPCQGVCAPSHMQHVLST